METLSFVGRLKFIFPNPLTQRIRKKISNHLIKCHFLFIKCSLRFPIINAQNIHHLKIHIYRGSDMPAADNISVQLTFNAGLTRLWISGMRARSFCEIVLINQIQLRKVERQMQPFKKKKQKKDRLNDLISLQSLWCFDKKFVFFASCWFKWRNENTNKCTRQRNGESACGFQWNEIFIESKLLEN